MPRKTKTTKKRPQKRKSYSPDMMGVDKVLEIGIKTAGAVAITGMTLGLTGSIIGGMSK